MKIIIPMAGIGKRMRPHTATVPKPLIPVAGKPIVQWLVEEIAEVAGEKIEEIAFVIGSFGHETEERLRSIGSKFGAKVNIYYQQRALGTAHAVFCAKESLNGRIIVAFADTLFKAGFKLDRKAEAGIWVQKVDDPGSFGVVRLNEKNIITDFIEKPSESVSDLAIIGIYYFSEGQKLAKALEYLINNKIIVNGEYQLTDALENMKNDGIVFRPGQVSEWLDCGNKNATLYTNRRILEHHRKEKLVSASAVLTDAVIVAPCYIGDHAIIEKSVVGPYVSVGDNTVIINSIIRNSIIQNSSRLKDVNLDNSMIGNHVGISGIAGEVSIGDYSTIEQIPQKI
ncbi:MAG: nucleotidyltransferase [Bacteroidetes bacterium]|nr:nucleotidyltransferase [Bacteroidota bacterium]